MQDQLTWPGFPPLARAQYAFGPAGGVSPDKQPFGLERTPPWVRPRRSIWQEPPRVQHSYIYGIEYADGTAVPVLASGAVDTLFTINVDGSAGFYATKLTGVFTDPRFRVQMRRGADGPTHFSRRVPATCCIGSGNLPFPLLPPIWMRPTLNFQFMLSDDGFAAENTIRLAMHGVAVYPDISPVIGARTYRGWDYQTYVIAFDSAASSDAQKAALGASLTDTASEGIGAEGDFLCYGMTMEATGGFLLDLTISGSKLRPFDRPIHASNLGATLSSAAIRSGMAPYFWPMEFLWPARTSIMATVTDLTAATNAIRLVFFGMRLLLAE